uniref:Uncharacterized protein AlNc14C23G2315 n=1 Tax=Albugo laibachii Nc14 TaxID=890382 RepID=F0W610_9STRA|nr:conserved hypothetical protein [Albugo laibachii Nc14]|eukprot:CCA16552.1 conserved hypothetical protein [Albugo laibachii Nc14]
MFRSAGSNPALMSPPHQVFAFSSTRERSVNRKRTNVTKRKLRRSKSAPNNGRFHESVDSCASRLDAFSPVNTLADLYFKVQLDPDSITNPKGIYTLIVGSIESNVQWQHPRPYEEYRTFQKGILRALQHGHFCDAECPWLYMFVKSYFPKKSLFSFWRSSSQNRKTRQDALHRFLQTLQFLLLAPQNHQCGILMTFVIPKFVQFLADESSLDDNHIHLCSSASIRSAHSFLTQQTKCESWKSITHQGSGPSLLENAYKSHDHLDKSTVSSTALTELVPDATVCTVCGVRLDRDPSLSASDNESSASFGILEEIEGRTSSQMSLHTSEYAPCLITLTCGHQFHDECIVFQLNMKPECPTCGVKQF